MNDFIPTNIDHICLLVNDLDETKDYLSSLFNFEIYPKPNSDNILMVENQHIHFFVKLSKLPKEFLKEQHLSLEISNLEAVKTKLVNRGIKFETGKFTKFKNRNYEWVEWNDSNGIRFECVKKII